MRCPRTLVALLSLAALAAGPAARAADVLPPGAKEAKARLEKSRRHCEYQDISVTGGKPLHGYVVYPEKKDKAPVVIVIHEIFGLTDWIKAVADQLAADGFIAVAPDLLSGMGPDGKGTEGFASGDDVRKAIQGLKPEQVVPMLNAVRDYGKGLPASNGKTATIGFCWGGGQSFAYAVGQPDLSAAVVYYGGNPKPDDAAKTKVPVLGNYGSDDARVNQTVGPAVEAVKKAGGKYEANTYEGAGHGFLRQQDGREGANLKAAQQAWPRTVAFIREHTK